MTCQNQIITTSRASDKTQAEVTHGSTIFLSRSYSFPPRGPPDKDDVRQAFRSFLLQTSRMEQEQKGERDVTCHQKEQ